MAGQNQQLWRKAIPYIWHNGAFFDSASYYNEAFEAAFLLNRPVVRNKLFSSWYPTNYHLYSGINDGTLPTASAKLTASVVEYLWGSSGDSVFIKKEDERELEIKIQNAIKADARLNQAIKTAISDAVDFGVGFVSTMDNIIANIDPTNVGCCLGPVTGQELFVIDKSGHYFLVALPSDAKHLGLKAEEGEHYLVYKITTHKDSPHESIQLVSKQKSCPIHVLRMNIFSGARGCALAALGAARTLYEMSCMTKKAQQLEILPPYTAPSLTYSQMSYLTPDNIYLYPESPEKATNADFRPIAAARGTSGVNAMTFWSTAIEKIYFLDILATQEGSAPPAVVSNTAKPFLNGFLDGLLKKYMTFPEIKKIHHEHSADPKETEFMFIGSYTARDMLRETTYIRVLNETAKLLGEIAPESSLYIKAPEVMKSLLESVFPPSFSESREDYQERLNQLAAQQARQQYIAAQSGQ